VLEGDHVVMSSVRGMDTLTLALIVCVVLLSVVAVVLASIICRRHHVTASQQRHADSDSCSSASLRTRLSPLHSNQLLCAAAAGDDEKAKCPPGYADELTGALLERADSPGDPLGDISAAVDGRAALETVACSQNEQQQQQLFIGTPDVITTGTTRSTQSASEFQIPADPRWEFPRDRLEHFSSHHCHFVSRKKIARCFCSEIILMTQVDRVILSLLHAFRNGRKTLTLNSFSAKYCFLPSADLISSVNNKLSM